MTRSGVQVGRWRLVRPLGRRTSSRVWLAESIDDPLDVVAVHLLPPNSTPQARAHFERAARVMRDLHHPGLVGYRDHASVPGAEPWWLATEHVDGVDLADVIARGPLDPAAARRLFRELSGALAHAHAHGVCHGDLRPRNIRVRADGRGVLVDLGLALQAGGVPRSSAELEPGAIGYLPPEVFERGARSEPRLADLYALGVMLDEVVEGRRAFPADDAFDPQQAMRIVAAKLERGKLVVGKAVPRDLADVIEVATHPDPARRLPSMAAFHDRLRGHEEASAAASSESDDELSLDPAALLDDGDGTRFTPVPAAPVVVAPPEVAEAPASPIRWKLLLAGALGAVGVVAAIAIVGALLLSRVAAPAVAEVDLPQRATLRIVTSAPADRVIVDGFEAVASGGGFVVSVEPGRHEALIAVGAACGGEAPSCGGCCACVRHLVDVRAPAGELHLLAPDVPASSRSVRVHVDGATDDLVVRVGDRDATRDGDAWTATAPIGRASVRVDVGACGVDDGGCAATGACPPGCGSTIADVAVDCGVEPLDTVVVAPVPAPLPRLDPRRRRVSPRDAAIASVDKAAAPVLVVSALGERLSGADGGVVARGVAALGGAAEACWRRLPPPHRAPPSVVVGFKVRRDGSVAPADVAVEIGSGTPLLDSCLAARVGELDLDGAKAGRARATFRFSVR